MVHLAKSCLGVNMKEMEKWLNTAKAPQDIVYYKGHLVEDNTKENPEVQKLAKLFSNAAGKDKKEKKEKRQIKKK